MITKDKGFDFLEKWDGRWIRVHEKRARTKKGERGSPALASFGVTFSLLLGFLPFSFSPSLESGTTEFWTDKKRVSAGVLATYEKAVLDAFFFFPSQKDSLTTAASLRRGQ